MPREETTTSPATPVSPDKPKGSRAKPKPVEGKVGSKPKKQFPVPEPNQSRGRKKIKDSLTTHEIAEEVKDLLKDLAASQDPEEKKGIRRALRLRGHYGGLGAKRGKKKAEDKVEEGEN